jgi:PhnB protein
MAARLNPYISFDNTAREALAFYAEVFGGTPEISAFSDFGGEGEGVMHGILETPSGFTIMAADTPEDYARPQGISISLSGENATADELRGYWEKLSSDGTVTVPLDKQMWGDEFGMCVDRFGINWMVNIGQQ